MDISKCEEYLEFIKEYGFKNKPKDIYTEKHHIIPKSCGGTNKKDNLIYLEARNHYIAHVLLFKHFKDTKYSKPLAASVWIMSAGMSRGDYLVTGIEYENARKEFGKSRIGIKQSPETIKKRVDKIKGENHPNYGKTGELSPTYGYSHTEETKQVMREKKLGLYDEKNNPMYGKHHSDETKRKISKNRKGKCTGNECNLYKNSYFSKAILCVETGEIFESLREAERVLGINHSDISQLVEVLEKLQEHITGNI